MNATAPSPTAQVTVAVHYRVTEVPPRCRKPRPVEHTDEFTFDVPVVDPADSPALYAQTAQYHRHCYVHDGAVYEQASMGDLRTTVEFYGNSAGYDLEAGEQTWSPVHPDVVASRARCEADKLIVRDGQLLSRLDQTPVYGWSFSTTNFGRSLHLSAGSTEFSDCFIIPAGEIERIEEIGARIATHQSAELSLMGIGSMWNPEAVEALGQPSLEDRVAAQVKEFEELKAFLIERVASFEPGGRYGAGFQDDLSLLEKLGRSIALGRAALG